MEPMKQREALTGEINWILSLTNLYGDQLCGGQDRRLGGHGTQLVYLHGGLQPTMR